MVDKKALRSRVKEESEKIFPELKKLKDIIGENPELGSEEEKASQLLVDSLRNHGFEVEYPFHEMHTAFKAVYKGSKPGPVIAILAEYDALPVRRSQLADDPGQIQQVMPAKLQP